MKIRYKKSLFHVCFSDMIKIEYYKILLFLKRQKRRLQILFVKQDIYLYILITILWLAYAGLSIVINKYICIETESKHGVVDVFLELKNSYYSSVVLSLTISVYNRGHKYHEQLMNQRFVYSISLWDFESLVDEVLAKKQFLSSAFFNDLCYQKSVKYINQKYKGGTIAFDARIYENLQCVFRRLEFVERQISDGKIVFCGFNCISDQLTLLDISDAINLVNKCLSDRYIDIINFKNLMNKLMCIIDALRTPWRRDWKVNLKILETLDKYPENKICEHVYLYLFLHGNNLEYSKGESAERYAGTDDERVCIAQSIK